MSNPKIYVLKDYNNSDKHPLKIASTNSLKLLDVYFADIMIDELSEQGFTFEEYCEQVEDIESYIIEDKINWC